MLSYLSYFDEIHAVCILLKPNNSRLTTLFRFCIQALLAQLHSSAAKNNIVFCFTNARATFYQPGDTLPVLNKILLDRKVRIKATAYNCFCFDNEPFRCLACVKNGMQFSQEEFDTYGKSWDKSVEETRRLFQYINFELEPHRVRDTISLNEARRFIVALSKPLAEVAKTIDYSVQAAEDAKEMIRSKENDIEMLTRKMTCTAYDIEHIDLEYPRLVCVHPSCVTYVPVGTGRVQHTIYRQTCQDPADISTFAALTRRLFGNMCQKCNHSYQSHIQVTYDTRVVKKEFLSPEAQEAIREKGSMMAKQEVAKQEIDKKIAELKKEEEHIMQTAVKFGSFLKESALIAYNDAMGDYIDMCINQEEKKSIELKNDTILAKLKEMKNKYQHEQEILVDAISRGTCDNINTEQVTKLQAELVRLKHFGPTLKRLFRDISITHSARNKAFGEVIAPIRQKERRFSKKNVGKIIGGRFW